MGLKHKEIEALSRDRRDRQVADGTPNLYLHVRSSGAVNWLCRTTIAGKRVPITIGPWPEISATAARAVTPVIVRLAKNGYSAVAIRNALKVTLDPDEVSARVRGEKVSGERITPTFEMVAREWYEKHLKDGLSEGAYKRQVIQQLEDHVFPQIGRRPINELRRREIKEAIADLWVNQHPTGKKVRGNIERIFDYAIDLELRDDNPAPPPRSMPLCQHRVEHFTSLPYERVQEFWAWLHTRPKMGLHTHVALCLAVLLGKRTGEIRKMTWDQLDLERGIWVTPPENMKKRKAHRQPLPTQAIEKLRLLDAAGRVPSGFLFDRGNGKPLSENAMLYALKRFADITTHGFRATMGSWCAENGVSKRVSDLIKAHQPKYLDAAYQRSDLLEERRAVLQRWADYVTASSYTAPRFADSLPD